MARLHEFSVSIKAAIDWRFALANRICHTTHKNGCMSPFVNTGRRGDACSVARDRIRSLDGTWHRPFTTLELAALQSLVDPEEFLESDGLSASAWRD